MLKKVVVIGFGIVGLSCVYLLYKYYDVIVFEKNDYIGGYIVIIDVKVDGVEYVVDIGFIVFNDCIYLYFEKLFKCLGVEC